MTRLYFGWAFCMSTSTTTVLAILVETTYPTFSLRCESVSCCAAFVSSAIFELSPLWYGRLRPYRCGLRGHNYFLALLVFFFAVDFFGAALAFFLPPAFFAGAAFLAACFAPAVLC